SVVRDTLCPKEGSPRPPVRIVARRPPEAAARRRASSCEAATFSSPRDGTGGGAGVLMSGGEIKHMLPILDCPGVENERLSVAPVFGQFAFSMRAKALQPPVRKVVVGYRTYLAAPRAGIQKH